MRLSAFLVAVLLGGCGGESATSPAPATASPPTAVPPTAEASPTAPTPPPGPAPTGPERCEGIVAVCGGWIGCAVVRADASRPGRFVGTGESSGRTYLEEDPACVGEACNAACTFGLAECRPGLREADRDVDCTPAVAPRLAPFTCTMEGGACVQGPDPAVLAAS